jgi:hypothetical protein
MKQYDILIGESGGADGELSKVVQAAISSAADMAYNIGIDDAMKVVIKAFLPVGEINGQLLEYIISELEVIKK